MFGRSYGIPSSLQISTNSQNEVECTGSPHTFKCPHRMNMIEYPRTDPPSYRDYITENVKGIFLTELSGESNFYELPDSSQVPELPENSLNHDQSTSIAGHIFINNQRPISSTLITEFPCVDGNQSGSRTPWYIESMVESKESLSSAGHCLSNTLDFDNSAEAEIIDANAEIRNQINAAHLSPDSSISMPLQSLTFRRSMCPTIQTNASSFRGNVDDTQYQGRLFEDSPQISSPDTASTDASGETFPSDWGYAPRAPQSDCTSAISPRSVFPGDERLGFEHILSSKAAQLSEFGHEGYLNQSCGLQSNQPNSLNWFGPVNSQSELGGLSRDHHIQVSYLSDFKENLLEFGWMGVVDDSSTAFIAQSVTDIDQIFPNHLFAGDASQYLQFPMQYEADYLGNITLRANKCATTSAATLTPATSTENQYAPNPFETYKKEHAFSLSAENLQGFDKNFNVATIPETQLPKEEEAKISTYDTSSPKSDNKVIKCSYPGCDHEPGGEDTWKIGNLGRHEREKHMMKIKDRIVCTIEDCKTTFTRTGNRDAHLENVHGVMIHRQKRTRRNSMTENIKKPRDGSRISKAPRKIGALTNRPKQNRSQSVPGPLDNTEF